MADARRIEVTDRAGRPHTAEGQMVLGAHGFRFDGHFVCGPHDEDGDHVPEPDVAAECPEWHCPDLSTEDRRDGKTCPDHPCTCATKPDVTEEADRG